MPRPKKQLSEALVYKLSSMALTQKEIATVCDCSVDLIQKKYHDVWEAGQENLKASLKRRQFIKAVKEGNTTMLIWLGKQHLGQRDNMDSTVDHTHRYYVEGPPAEATEESWQERYSPAPKNPPMQ